MTLRLKNRLASGLIVTTIGVTAAALASAADNAPGAAAGASSAGNQATTTGATSPSTSATTPPSSGSAPSASSTGSDTTMAPRGADPAQTTNRAAAPATNGDSPAKKIFDQLDLNHDGMLSLDEFSRATFQQPATK